MKPVFHTLSLAVIALSLNACKTTGPQPDNVGPFDANGNYIEAWADNPPKSRSQRSSYAEIDPPAVAAHEQPNPSGTPIIDLPPAQASPTKKIVSTPRPTPKPTQTASRTTTKPKSTTTSSTTKSKPKTVVAKSKPKPKPATVTRYTVKKGDSLSTIAARNGTTVTALKSANGISGTLIHPGKSLVIPRRK
jgi:LysM repeat protein